MLFDRFAKLVGRGRPAGLWPAETVLLDDARLFLFEEPVWGCRESYDSGQLTDLDDLRDHFRLPFRTVAVELSTLQSQPGEWQSCVLIHDFEKGSEGLRARRQCVVFMDTEGDEYFVGARDYGPEVQDPKFAHLMTLSDVKLSPIVDSSDGRPEVQFVWHATYGYINPSGRPREHRLHITTNANTVGRLSLPPEHRSWLTTSAIDARPGGMMPPIGEALSQIDRAIVGLHLAMRQERFILETRPAKPRSHPKGHIARSHERPVYTALTPKEIRERLRLPAPGEAHGPVGAHERRGHWRR